VPLISQINKAIVQLCDEQARVLQVSWVLANGKLLELAANLAERSAVLPINVPSNLIYASDPESAKDGQQVSLPPWSVIWRLRS
jgi:Domain of unknown function (DUF3459)